MGRRYKMSSTQKRLYAINQLDIQSISYNMPILVQIEGHIDIEKLQIAVEKLCQRHELLRTHFCVEDNLFLQIVEDDISLKVEYEQIDTDRSIYEVYKEFVRPFDLTKAPLMRVKMVKDSLENVFLLIDIHHIIGDGESANIIWSEIVKLYQGEELEELELQYKDYSAWQDSLDLQEQEDYWLGEFSGDIPVLDLKTDFPRPRYQSYKGKNLLTRMNYEQREGIINLSRKNQTTEYIIMMSAFYVFLSKYTRQNEIILGMPIAGRTNSEIENMLGMFVNTLAIKGNIDKEDTFNEFVQKIQHKFINAYENQDYPFDELVNKLNIERDPSRNPLFDVMFSQENTGEEMLFGDLKAKVVEVDNPIAKFDLSVTVIPTPEGYIIGWEYCEDLFKEKTIAYMGEHYLQLISDIIKNPDKKIKDLVMLSEEEKERVLYKFNETYVEYPKDSTIIELFEKQVEKYPNNIAVEFEGNTLTYKELNDRANYIGQILRNKGIKPDDIVGIITERSLEMIVAVYGVFKAGAAYMPIDPGHPIDRVRFMLEESKAQVILVGKGSELLTKQIENIEIIDLLVYKDKIEENLEHVSTPRNLAYIIFTSGSTGKPKGVMVEIGGVVNVSYWQILNGEMNQNTKVIQNFNYIFDASVSEIYPTGLVGGRLILLPENKKTDPEKFIELLPNSQLCLVPSMFRAILEYANAHNKLDVFNKMDKIYLAAEALPSELLKRYMELTGNTLERLYNIYGPTETTDSAVCFDFRHTKEVEVVPIGKPISNLQLYIMNDERLCGIGVPGELYIGGAGVSRGYLNRPDLTQERFIENPYRPGDRIYRTGDLTCWMEDGNIEYLGRIDEQVKLRGYRIELGEIENRLKDIAEIIDAAVVIREKNGDKFLCGYIIASKTLDFSDIKAVLQKKLPEYMVPTAFMQLEAFPLTRTGKLDRKALPEPTLTASNKEYIAPNTTEECTVVEAFEEILRVEEISIDDDFFELGGDSIKAIRIVSKLREHGYEIGVKDIMKARKVKEIACLLKRISRKQDTQQEVVGEIALTPIQQDFLRNIQQDIHHFNQSMIVECNEAINVTLLEKVIKEIVKHHDMLRASYQDGRQKIRSAKSERLYCLKVFDYNQYDDLDQVYEMIDKESDVLQRNMDLANGPLLNIGVFQTKSKDYVVLCIHHLVVDGVSWRILLEDLNEGYRAISQGNEIKFPMKTTSFMQWSNTLQQYKDSYKLKKEIGYWKQTESNVNAGKIQCNEGAYGEGTDIVTLEISNEQTQQLIYKVGKAYNTEINDILLTIVASGVNELTGQEKVAFIMESHGREILSEEVQLDRTVGWFTTLYPVVVNVKSNTIRDNIIQVKEELHRIPNNGIGYGILKTLKEDILEGIEPDITFNYLGEFNIDDDESIFSLCDLAHGKDLGESVKFSTPISIDAAVIEGKLQINITYERAKYTKNAMERLATCIKSQFKDVIEHCMSVEKLQQTASDLGEYSWSQNEFESVLEKVTMQGYTIKRILPLTPMQEGMLYHKLVNEESTQYVLQSIYKAGGWLKVDYFEEAIRVLVDKHEALKLAIAYKLVSEPRQMILEGRPVNYQFKDLSEDKNQIAELKRIQKEDVKRGFDLEEDSLLRVIVVKMSNIDYRIIIDFHHIIVDGWCTSIIMQDLIEIYHQLVQGQSKKEISSQWQSTLGYEDYVSFINNRDRDEALQYWNTLLSDYENQAAIMPENNIEDMEIESSVIEERLTIEETQALVKLSNSYGITINTFVEAAWGIILQRYNNVNDVVFGKVTSGRNAELKGIEEMVGLFINTIPIRVKVEETQTFKELLISLQSQALQSLKYEYAPLAQIQKLTIQGSELIQTILAFENYYSSEDDVNSEQLVLDEGREQTSYDLSLAAYKSDELIMGLMYNTRKYNVREASRILNRVKVVLKNVINNPEILISDIELVDELELRQVTQEFGMGESCEYQRHSTIIEVFEELVQKQPDQVAVRIDDSSITYKQINERANEIGDFLRNRGIGKEQVVPLMANRSIEMISSILGILKAGGAYLPIDPNLPKNRIEYILEDSKAEVVLMVEAERDDIRELENIEVLTSEAITGKKENLQHIATPDSLAYVIYTSGTTGKPKGVMIQNRNVLNLCAWQQKNGGYTSDTIVLQNFNYIFDGSVWEIFPALLNGATLELVSQENSNDPEKLLNMLENKQVTLVPSMFRVLVDYAATHNMVHQLNSFERLYVAAEAFPLDLINKYKELEGSHVQDVFNLYGPTECTVCATGYRLGEKELYHTIPIGKPIGNTKVYIMNNAKICGIGMPGELCIGGTGVARGYLNKPQLTSEKFIYNPYCLGEVIYRTGDMVRWMEDGNIEYLGRIDEQVKVKGFRIELEEIENHLRSIENIKNAAVTIRQKDKEKVICAYIISNDVLELEAIKGELRKNLPGYMIPTKFMQLDELPISASGKLDKKSLPEIIESFEYENYIPPSTVEEKCIAEVFCEILNVEKISIVDDFFENGGDSIKAMRLVSKIREKGYKLSLKDILEEKNVKNIAHLVKNKDEALEMNEKSIGQVDKTIVGFIKTNFKLDSVIKHIKVMDKEETVLFINNTTPDLIKTIKESLWKQFNTKELPDYILKAEALNKIQETMSLTSFHELCSKFTFYKVELVQHIDKQALNNNINSRVENEYKASDIQELLLSLPYSIIQDEVLVEGKYSVEQLTKAIRNVVRNQSILRSSYRKKGNEYTILEHEFKEDFYIPYFDITYQTEEVRHNTQEQINDVWKLIDTFKEGLVSSHIIIIKRTEKLYSIQVAAHHSMWDKVSTSIFKKMLMEQLGEKQNVLNTSKAYKYYAANSHRIEDSVQGYKRILDFCNYLENNNKYVSQKKIKESKFAVIKMSPEVTDYYNENTWHFIEHIVSTIAVGNDLILKNNEYLPAFIVQADRGVFGEQYASTLGVCIDTLPVLIQVNDGLKETAILEQIEEINILKKQHKVKMLKALEHTKEFQENVLLINYIGLYEFRAEEIDNIVNSSFKEGSKEIMIGNYDDQLIVRYPIFEECETDITALLQEKLVTLDKVLREDERYNSYNGR